MEITQKKASTVSKFQFGKDQLAFTLKDASGTTSFRVDYEEIPTESNFFEERKAWFRNVGGLWVILGVLFTGMNYVNDASFTISFWVWIGLACLAYYKWSVVSYAVYDTPKGRLFVIENDQKDAVLAAIEQHRNDQLVERYARIINAHIPEQEAARFNWLLENGKIQRDQFEDLIIELQLAVADISAQQDTTEHH